MKYGDFMKSRGMVNSPKDTKVTKETDIIKEKETINSDDNNNPKVNLSEMDKNTLLKFAGKRKLTDKSFKGLEPGAIIPIILEKARDKVVEAGLKTAYEAASLAEDELFTLFDTIN